MSFYCRACAAAGLLFTATALGPLGGTWAHPARPQATARPFAPDELYSRRALRRARLIVQMRLLELHRERLDCVERAIRQMLPLDVPAPVVEDNAVKPSDTRDVLYRSTRLLDESETCAWSPGRLREPRRSR